MKGFFTTLILVSLTVLSGCNLTDKEKDKLDKAAVDLEKLADQIIITYPAKDSVVEQSIATLRADIPADAEAQEVALFVDGIEIAKDTDGAPWEIQWPAYYYADGKPHSLLLKTITGSGAEVRNNEQFQVTVSVDANNALRFSEELEGTQIQDKNQLDVSFAAFTAATRYEVTDGSQIVKTETTNATLSNLDVGSYTVRYRAIFDYSTSTTLTGPWSAPLQVEVLPPQLPVIHTPVVKKNELGYEISFSWDALAEDDIYSVSLKKSGEIGAYITQSNAPDELVMPGMEMGMYKWSLIRHTSLGQNVESEAQEIGLGVFKRQLGGTADDLARHVIASRDGGFIILGDTKSQGDSRGDDWIVKLDANGLTEWEYVLSKSGGSRLQEIREFSSGSIYAYGYNGSYQDRKGYLIKLSGLIDTDERLLWEVEYRAEYAEREDFQSITEKDSALYVVSEESERVNLDNGSYRFEYTKQKLLNIDTETGELVSAVELPGLGGAVEYDRLSYLSVTSDNNFLLSCSAKPELSTHIFEGAACIVKFDAEGTLVWSWNSVGSSHFLNGRFGIEAPWGEYILAGQSYVAENAQLAKISSSGSLSGTLTSGIGTYSNQQETIVFDDNENMLMLLSGNSSEWPELWSTSRYGNTQKIKTFTELKYDYSYPKSLDRAADGGLILLFNESQSGYKNFDIIVLKTDINGNM